MAYIIVIARLTVKLSDKSMTSASRESKTSAVSYNEDVCDVTPASRRRPDVRGTLLITLSRDVFNKQFEDTYIRRSRVGVGVLCRCYIFFVKFMLNVCSFYVEFFF